MKTRKMRMAALVLAVSLSGTAQAALVDRGGGLIYDTDLNVTWLQDANYAKTSGHDADGAMTWQNAMDWAANLSYYDSVRDVTFSDWRLPTTTDTGAPGAQFSYNGTDWGYNVDPASSEMAYLFYTELGNTSPYSTTGENLPAFTILKNTGPFTNIQSYVYWSSTEYPLEANSVWFFSFDYGYQNRTLTNNVCYAWAVRNGDVAAVPEADTWAMLLAGLGLVGTAARRRRC